MPVAVTVACLEVFLRYTRLQTGDLMSFFGYTEVVGDVDVVTGGKWQYGWCQGCVVVGKRTIERMRCISRLMGGGIECICHKRQYGVPLFVI